MDDHGVPRFWSTVWLDTFKTRLAHSTRQRYCKNLGRLYEYSDELYGTGSLDRAITNLEFDQIERILSGFLQRLRRQHYAIGRSPAGPADIWRVCKEFLFTLLEYLTPNTSAPSLTTLLLRLQHRLQLYDQLTVTAQFHPPVVIRVIPATVLCELAAIFAPRSNENPFKSADQQWRNWLLFHLYLSLGLRRGEALLLDADCIKHEKVRTSTGVQEIAWLTTFNRQSQDNDPRHSKPALKTAFSQRDIPVSRELLTIFDTYTRNFRPSSKYPQLLISRNGRPLSSARVNSVFSCARRSLSNAAQATLYKHHSVTLSPHSLRHTAAVYRIRTYVEQGFSLDNAVEKLRVFFGWAPNSQMPRLYARAYFESSHQQIWTENFDNFIQGLTASTGEHDYDVC
ncbi:tyrosine-type recombinase/integrase [Thalassospira sp. A3_1]|uniref:tyrosine-type recombinase/integrase n=1 Tax=Thalassospira sp. A3_1 TaxID=2821088 RepID=UPI001AD9EF87|nr:tyrosine-type recombinase/integrase [Thalassospira sp. A3_1]